MKIITIELYTMVNVALNAIFTNTTPLSFVIAIRGRRQSIFDLFSGIWPQRGGGG